MKCYLTRCQLLRYAISGPDEYMGVEYWWTDIDKEKTAVPGGKPVLVPFFLQHVLHGMTWYRTRAFAMTGRRLSA
jgi:hypothetical protein